MSDNTNSNTDKSNGYVLPYTDEERQRLNVQHWVIRKLWWNDQILFVPLDRLQANKQSGHGGPLRVLDSAAGTGVWTMEARSEMPEDTEFLMLDIDLSANERTYPTLPPNVSRVQHNLLSGPDGKRPSELNRPFDLIQQRLLFFVFSRAQWLAVLRSYLALLKPGGFLQLLEFDVTDMHLGPAFGWLTERLMPFVAQRGIELAIVPHLSSLLQEAGFTNIVEKESWLTFPDPEKGKPADEPLDRAAEVWYADTADAVTKRAREMGVIGEREWEENFAEIKEEAKHAAKRGYKWRSVVLVAQKPQERGSS